MTIRDLNAWKAFNFGWIPIKDMPSSALDKRVSVLFLANYQSLPFLSSFCKQNVHSLTKYLSAVHLGEERTRYLLWGADQFKMALANKLGKSLIFRLMQKSQRFDSTLHISHISVKRKQNKDLLTLPRHCKISYVYHNCFLWYSEFLQIKNLHHLCQIYEKQQ